MIKLSVAIASTAVFLTLSGCALPEDPHKAHPTVISSYAEDTRHAQATMTEAAVSVSHSLNELARIERASHPTLHFADPVSPKKLGMEAIASVDWTGPLEPLIEKLAKACHYKVNVVGRRPTIPALVSVSAHNATLAQIMRNAVYQAQKKAQIAVYASSKVIEIRYKNT